MIMAVAITMATAVCVSAANVSNATGRVNVDTSLNLRKSADPNSEVLCSLKDNTKLTIKSVTFVSSTSTKANMKWYKVTVNSKTGYVRSDYVDTIKYTPVDAKTTDEVNYRSGAGTGSGMKVKGTLQKSKKVQVYLKAIPAVGTEGGSKTWYMIKVGDKYYYVCSKYFKLIEAKTDKETTAADKKAEEEAKKKAEEEAKKKAEEEAKKFTITVSNLTYPSENTPMTEGRAFSLTGTIKTSDIMTNVNIGIMDTDSNWVVRVPKQPNSKTFDVSSVDNDIRFGILNAGTYKYVAKVKVNGITKTAFSHKFSVINTVEKTLTDKTVKKRIDELLAALDGKYFTVDGKPANGSVDEACNVEKVIKKNSIVLDLLKTNKGGSNLNASLLPSHCNPGGIAQIKGWSCCGFANFAGWYIAADSINDDVSFKPIKMGIDYTYENMSKYARVGDILRSSSHSYMVISVDSDGCTVIDCNWDYHSIVSKHTVAWGKYSTVTINRAINRVD